MSVSMLRLEPKAAAPGDDADLIERARAGDREAQEHLVRRHLADVYDVAYRVLGDRDLAQDAAQDALVNALRALHKFRGDSSFRTWLLRITTNAARSAGRRQGRRREVALTVVENTAGAEDEDAAARAATRDEADRIHALLEKLPTKQRLAVSLRIHQGLSYAEIGKVIDCSEGAARVNYHLGIRKLRELVP